MENDNLKEEAENLLRELFPINRSITGSGVRKSLKILSKVADFEIKGVPSGTKCYDWEIPPEWELKDAYVEDSKGKRIIDIKDSNLHVMGYSTPVDRKVPYSELIAHIHTMSDMPDAIPYRTSYYDRKFGFCMRHKDFLKLDKTETYHMHIDSSLKEGSLTYGERILKGTSGKEFIISTYCCHPSLANDNLSGMVLWVLLLRNLSKRKLRHTYRFVIAPETIGAIAYCSLNEEAMKNIEAGLVITTVAGPGKRGYKRSFMGSSIIDMAIEHVFRQSGIDFIRYPFDIQGSDERQFSSLPFRIPICTITKDKYYEYPYYHTSLDNLDFIKSDWLIEALGIYLKVIESLENSIVYAPLNHACEPMLGKRGAYPKTGGAINQNRKDAEKDKKSDLDVIKWILFLSDGKKTLLEISEETGIDSSRLNEAAIRLCKLSLLKEVK